MQGREQQIENEVHRCLEKTISFCCQISQIASIDVQNVNIPLGQIPVGTGLTFVCSEFESKYNLFYSKLIPCGFGPNTGHPDLNQKKEGIKRTPHGQRDQSNHGFTVRCEESKLTWKVFSSWLESGFAHLPLFLSSPHRATFKPSPSAQ